VLVRTGAGSGRDERGAIAILVTLTMVVVLIPTAALALDLGNVYTRNASLQRAADDAAIAGAVELARGQRAGPADQTALDAAREAAVGALCHDPELSADTNGDGVPDGPWRTACTGGHAWATDNDDANGEVTFYSGRPSADHVFTPDQVTEGGDLITGIRVVSPSSRVTYGLGAISGTDHTDVQKASTAALWTTLPVRGYLPLFTTSGEYGPFCARSAPRTVWQNTHPTGVCDPASPQSGSTARGYLNEPRSDGHSPPTSWNTATGFDADHLVTGPEIVNHPNQVRLQPQLSPQSALLRDLSPGFFGGNGAGGASGRLSSTTACPGGLSSTSGSNGGGISVEGAHLADFVDTRVGSAAALKLQISSPTAPSDAQVGWLRPSILRCGRLAVVPEVGVTAPLPVNGIPGTTLQVTRLRLVWLDNEFAAGEASGQHIASGNCLKRGFYWADPNYYWVCTSTLRAITGFILDPRLLPATVSGQDATNTVPYLGSGLPATVRLIRDAWDPPPG
jgi:Flp pilus assembly protein TadG